MIAALCVNKGRIHILSWPVTAAVPLVCTQAAEDLWKNDKAAQISK